MSSDQPASWRMPTPKQMEKLAAEQARALARSEPVSDARRHRSRGGKACCRTRALPASLGCRSHSAGYLKSPGTCSVSTACVAIVPLRFRRPTRSSFSDRMRCTETWRFVCSATLADIDRDGLRRMGAGRIGRSRSHCCARTTISVPLVV